MNMSSLTLLKITYIILSLQITVLSLTETLKLKPSTISSAPDISVSLGPGASIINDFWHIDVISQHSADLHIQLGPSWGFHPTQISTIDLFIRGNTSTETLTVDGEIFFIFATTNTYFAELVSIDKNAFAYKQCPDINKPLISRNITKMINSPLPERYYRYCNNSVDTHVQDPQGADRWDNTGGSPYRTTAEWPMSLSIRNDPIANTIDYTYTDWADPPGPKLTSHFTSSFPTNQGLNIYIAGESQGEDFNIFSVDITYSHLSTNAPTSNPITNTPTNAPITLSPTTLQPTLQPITVQPTTNQPTTMIPSIMPTVTPITIAPTTFEPTTVAPTTVEPTTTAPTTSIPTFVPSVNPSIAPSVTEVSEPPLIIPSTTKIAAGHVVSGTDVIDNTKGGRMGVGDSKHGWNDSLWYIIGIVLLALVCVCCVIICILLKKRKYDEKANVSIKDYKGVKTMHRQSNSLQTNQLYNYDGNNNTKHIKKMTNSIDCDVDLTNTYNEHHYKSSDSKLNEAFDLNKHTFSNHISSAVTGDELILDDIHNHMETAGGPQTISDDEIINNRNGTLTDSYQVINQGNNRYSSYNNQSLNQQLEMHRYNNNNNNKFNNNLANVAQGNNMMMNDIINQMETQKGDFDSSFENSNSNSEENNNDTIHDDEYFKSGYEMGMVNVSKISEMAPRSGTKTSSNYHNNDSLIMEGNTLNDDYDNNNSNEEDLNSEQLLDEMETAGFIDGDYNELEYEDEYYQEEDDGLY